jgi:thiosulfate reductase cytochrome b subunit
MLERRVPLALVLTLFLQAAMGVWWASASAAQDHFRDRRLDALEQNISMNNDRQVAVLERLAKLEAVAEEAHAILQRIETRLIKR